MKRLLMLVLVVVGLVAAYSAGDERNRQADREPTVTDTPENASTLSRWMHAKSSAGQQVFVSLTEGNFEELEKQARRMQVLNFLEQWVRETDFQRRSEYQGQLNAFDFATKELIRHARDRSIDGSLESYILLTQSCVRCHKLIRDVPAGESSQGASSGK